MAADPLDRIAEICHDQPPDALAQIASILGFDEPPEFTDTSRDALLWVLWHHQSSSTEVGQAIRFALGKGAHDPLTKHEVTRAKRWASHRPNCQDLKTPAFKPPPAQQSWPFVPESNGWEAMQKGVPCVDPSAAVRRLTDEEIDAMDLRREVSEAGSVYRRRFARAIEAYADRLAAGAGMLQGISADTLGRWISDFEIGIERMTKKQRALAETSLSQMRDALASGVGGLSTIQDNELPGMWEKADFEGGQDEVRGPDWKPARAGVPVGDERQQFEAVMRGLHPEWSFTPDPVFDYHNERTRCAWEGWKAAAGVSVPAHQTVSPSDADPAPLSDGRKR